MITITDVGEIIYDACREFGVDTYLRWNIPSGKVTRERITIYPKSIGDGTYWERGFVEVNWAIPDIDGECNPSIGEIERRIAPLYYGQGVRDDTAYRYVKHSVEILEDKDFGCHYFNLRLVFNILKVK